MFSPTTSFKFCPRALNHPVYVLYTAMSVSKYTRFPFIKNYVLFPFLKLGLYLVQQEQLKTIRSERRMEVYVLVWSIN